MIRLPDGLEAFGAANRRDLDEAFLFDDLGERRVALTGSVRPAERDEFAGDERIADSC